MDDLRERLADAGIEPVLAVRIARLYELLGDAAPLGPTPELDLLRRELIFVRLIEVFASPDNGSGLDNLIKDWLKTGYANTFYLMMGELTAPRLGELRLVPNKRKGVFTSWQALTGYVQRTQGMPPLWSK